VSAIEWFEEYENLIIKVLTKSALPAIIMFHEKFN